MSYYFVQPRRSRRHNMIPQNWIPYFLADLCFDRSRPPNGRLGHDGRISAAYLAAESGSVSQIGAAVDVETWTLFVFA